MCVSHPSNVFGICDDAVMLLPCAVCWVQACTCSVRIQAATDAAKEISSCQAVMLYKL